MASLLVLPRASYSLGASGAVFGLYAVSVLLKLSSGLSLRKFVEASARLGYTVLLPLQATRLSADMPILCASAPQVLDATVDMPDFMHTATAALQPQWSPCAAHNSVFLRHCRRASWGSLCSLRSSRRLPTSQRSSGRAR